MSLSGLVVCPVTGEWRNSPTKSATRFEVFLRRFLRGEHLVGTRIADFSDITPHGKAVEDYRTPSRFATGHDAVAKSARSWSAPAGTRCPRTRGDDDSGNFSGHSESCSPCSARSIHSTISIHRT